MVMKKLMDWNSILRYKVLWGFCMYFVFNYAIHYCGELGFNVFGLEIL